MLNKEEQKSLDFMCHILAQDYLMGCNGPNLTLKNVCWLAIKLDMTNRKLVDLAKNHEQLDKMLAESYFARDALVSRNEKLIEDNEKLKLELDQLKGLC